ncbi:MULTISPECIES: NAD(+) kinase [unclassified Zymobacter]|uniref:NAD(+) kinase n=1 Tax=unclassified Zymobacter TaxID=3048685 RepID=UPI0039C3DD9D
MPHFKTVGLVMRPGSHHSDETLGQVLDILSRHEIDIILDERILAAEIGCVSDDCDVSRLPRAALETLGRLCDMVIVIGGDGSMLGAARTLCLTGTPVLGINRGRVGFLTDISTADLELRLEEILSGTYVAEHRFLLDAFIMREGRVVSCAHALNDVVLHSGQVARMVEFTLFIDDQFVYRQRADGLIVATPTGSTAYALSAGGPMLHPSLEAMVLVPMFPHVLSNRPLVIGAASKVSLRIEHGPDPAPQLSCDGQTRLVLQPGDRIDIIRKPQRLVLLHPQSHDYFDSCRSKLGWSSSTQECP